MLIRSVPVVLLAATIACLQVAESPPPPQTRGAGEIPFELAGKGGAAIVVPVQINDSGPYRFIVDTGATVTCVDRTLAERLDLPQPSGVVGFGATVGQSGAVSVHRIDTLRVGDTTASDVMTCALDLGNMKDVGIEADGLLGLNFLKSFKVTFDFQRNILSLESGA